jgi:hypothetical protein
MDIGGATLAAAAMRAGLIDEYAIVTHPVLVGGGTLRSSRPWDNWVNLKLVETRTFPDGVLLTRSRPGAEYPTPDRRGLGPPKDLVAIRGSSTETPGKGGRALSQVMPAAGFLGAPGRGGLLPQLRAPCAEEFPHGTDIGICRDRGFPGR